MRYNLKQLALFIIYGSACAIVYAQAEDTPSLEKCYGFSIPFREIEISSPESGIIDEIKVSEGDLVKKGMVVAKLDRQVLQAHLEIARMRAGSYGKIEALTLERDLQRVRYSKLFELLESGDARKDEVQRSETNLAIADANIQQALEVQKIEQLDVKRIEAQIERRILRSPIDGVVTKIVRDVGENLTIANSHVMTIVQLDPLRVICYLSPSQAAAVELGKSLDVIFEDSDKKVAGTIEFISPIVDAESGTVRTKLLIKNGDGKLRSGVRCRVIVGVVK